MLSSAKHLYCTADTTLFGRDASAALSMTFILFQDLRKRRLSLRAERGNRTRTSSLDIVLVRLLRCTRNDRHLLRKS